MGARRSCLAALVCSCALGLLSTLGSSLAFAAAPPTVGDEYVMKVGITSTTLQAEINPNEVATSYRFEYGPTSAYGTSVPVPDLGVGAGASAVLVSQTVGGLTASTSYHYRVVASNAEGTVEGEDRVFTTFPAGVPVNDGCSNAAIRQTQSASALPDCRAYEMVSPPDVEKEGHDIMGDPYNEVASSDGNAFVFESASYGSGNAITLGAQYLATRSPGSWSNYDIDPVQDSQHLGFGSLLTGSLYVGFSGDLSKGVFLANSPVTAGHPNVESVGNLYLRSDLLTEPLGEYDLLTDSVSPAIGVQSPSLNWALERRPMWVGASADWSHIVFMSRENLTADAPPQPQECIEFDSECEPRLYEWHAGLVKLVGILPNGTPAQISVPGGGGNIGGAINNAGTSQELYRRNVISSDGSRVLFEAPPSARSVPGEAAGNLYMRINGTQTIQLNVSERNEPDQNGPQPAVFETATPDDSKVFFITSEALTNDAAEYGSKLYVYDMNAPEGKHLTLISVDKKPDETERYPYQNPAIAVAGMSEDGSYVYFTGENELVQGMPPAEENQERRLYVWHDGDIRYITTHGTYTVYAWNDYRPFINSDVFRVSRDGKTAAFSSADPKTAQQAGFDNVASSVGKTEVAGLVPCSEKWPNRATNQYRVCEEVYTYSYDAGKLACASCNHTGALPDGSARFIRLAALFAGTTLTSHLNHPLSSDGRYVFFDTADALVSQDVNAQLDVYEYDIETGEVHLLSPGTCDCGSTFVDASEDGSNVFFVTRQTLVAADSGTSSDLYDVRIDGGIPGQNRPVPVACAGEECQGPAGSPPVFSVPSSATFAGVGNQSQSKARSAPKRAKHTKHRRSRHAKKKHKGRKFTTKPRRSGR